MTSRRTAIAALVILAAAAAALLAMGRNPICTCGSVALWVGERDSPRTSQMLSDWYSFSHIVHGLIFYAALWLIALVPTVAPRVNGARVLLLHGPHQVASARLPEYATAVNVWAGEASVFTFG